MSADNGLSVQKINNKYHVRYYQGEGDAHTRLVYNSPLEAIVSAHHMQSRDQTEYGVSVSQYVLADAKAALP